MLLRRITQHVKAQNWFAVCIDSVPSYADRLRRTMPYEIQSALRSGGCNASFSTDANSAIAALVPDSCPLDVSAEKTEFAIQRLLAADLEPDLTRALADFDLKLQLFQVWNERSQKLYDYLETTK